MIEFICKIQINKAKHFVVREREYKIKQRKLSPVTINLFIANSRDNQ